MKKLWSRTKGFIVLLGPFSQTFVFAQHLCFQIAAQKQCFGSVETLKHMKEFPSSCGPVQLVHDALHPAVPHTLPPRPSCTSLLIF